MELNEVQGPDSGLGLTFKPLWFQSSFRAVSERKVLEQFQSSFRAVLEQF